MTHYNQSLLWFSYQGQSVHDVQKSVSACSHRLVLQVGDGVFEVLSTAGDTHLGGDDFDKRIVDFLADDFKRSEGLDLRKDRQVQTYPYTVAQKISFFVLPP